jgi:hypothetical protein
MNAKSIKKVFILGAGFSKNFGLPLTNEIFTKGYSRLIIKHPIFEIKFSQEWSRLIDHRPFEILNYEEMLSRIDHELALADGRGNYRLNYSLWRLRDSVLQIFWEALQGNVKQNYSSLYSRFFNICSSDSTIISFNQDLMIEKYFEGQRIKYSYGFLPTMQSRYGRMSKPEIQFPKERSDFGHQYNFSQKKYVNNKYTYLLLKPHGSFDWLFCPQCHDVRITSIENAGLIGEPFVPTSRPNNYCAKPVCNEKSQGMQMELSNLIVPPTAFKNINHFLLRKIWFKSSNLISNADEIHIIGYSFSEIDVLSNWIFYQAIQNSLVNRIIIVDPAIKSLIGNRIKSLLPIRLKHKIEYCKQFDEYLNN